MTPAIVDESNEDGQMQRNNDDIEKLVTQEKAKEPPKSLAIFYVFLLANLLSLVYMTVQVLTKKLLWDYTAVSSFELTFFRSLFNFMASSFYLVVAKVGLRDNIDATNRHILAIRCVSGSICFLCFVVAIEYLPLAIFFVIMNAAPFFIAVIACLWLKEVISKLEVFTMVFAFAGIVMVALSKQETAAAEEE